jgi:hypothetical protein
VTPDYTTVDPKSGARLSCQVQGSDRSRLVVAGLFVAGTPYTPTVANIAAGLAHAATGQHLSPPQTRQDGADPMQWVPLVSTVKVGYPLVGFTTFDFAQCYADKNVALGEKAFLKLHYAGAGYAAIEHANGFATLGDVQANGFLADIEANMLANRNRWQTDIADAAACAGKSGR